ncbi:MAG: hypothetical protein IKY83_05205, partial [Proteobacteria bacterium]|nr:hypothetical protein [Pseudomonadota bacterium]
MKKLTWLFAAMLSVFPMTMVAETAVAQTAQVDQDAINKANDPSQMLPQEIEAKFKAVRSDPDPDALVRDAHYWVSNENAHYVWYPYIKDRGGVLSGVGTDQVYMLAAWSNASIVIPMDFDRMITNLHFAYGAAFLASDNIEEFRTYWKKENSAKMKAALEKYFPDHAEAAFKAWKTGCSEVIARFNRIKRKYTVLGTYLKDKAKAEPKQYGANAKKFSEPLGTFITDEAQFKRIKTLWENHRVFPVCGDLTGDKAMIDIAKALNDSGLKMTILYPSNAEHYFEYGAKYRRNIVNMPFADNSLVLRTRQMRSLGVAEEEDYHYN